MSYPCEAAFKEAIALMRLAGLDPDGDGSNRALSKCAEKLWTFAQAVERLWSEVQLPGRDDHQRLYFEHDQSPHWHPDGLVAMCSHVARNTTHTSLTGEATCIECVRAIRLGEQISKERK